MAAEMKLLVAAPSVKNWPLALCMGALLVLVGAIGFALQFCGFNAALLILAAGVALTVVPALKAAGTEYTVTNSRVYVRSGILSKTETSISLEIVRELRLKRSPIQRSLGLGDIEIVGERESMLLAGLDDPEQFRDRILSLAE